MAMRSGEKLKVLLVDDHEDSLRYMELLVSTIGCVVRTAADVGEALTLAASMRFDLLLSDISLPDGDGCQLLARVHAEYPIRAVAVTGHGRQTEIEKFLSAGFEAVLVKPVEVATLRKVIERVLSNAALTPTQVAEAD